MANQNMFDEFNKKMFEAEKFIVNALSGIEAFANESKENIEKEIGNVQKDLVNLKNQFTAFTKEAEDTAILEISKVQENIESEINNTKKKIEEFKNEKNKEMSKKYIESLLNYANACTELSSIVANESKAAYLDALKAKAEYIKEFGAFE